MQRYNATISSSGPTTPHAAMAPASQDGWIDRSQQRLRCWRRDTEQSSRDEGEESGMVVH